MPNVPEIGPANGSPFITADGSGSKMKMKKREEKEGGTLHYSRLVRVSAPAGVAGRRRASRLAGPNSARRQIRPDSHARGEIGRGARAQPSRDTTSFRVALPHEAPEKLRRCSSAVESFFERRAHPWRESRYPHDPLRRSRRGDGSEGRGRRFADETGALNRGAKAPSDANPPSPGIHDVIEH